MDNEAPRFPDYGDSGDFAGARRARHAFRWLVAACVLATGLLYFVERALKHAPAERSMIMALTLPRESARVFLIKAIEQDAKANERPDPRFSQALAVRQEDDVILDDMRRAYEMDTANVLFALQYGCRLFAARHFEKAAAIFNLAQASPSESALPAYLEAAAIAARKEDPDALEQAMIIVARANSGGLRLVFPRPVWTTSPALPQRGEWYARLTREVVADTAAPLYVFAENVLRQAKSAREQGRVQLARSWLEQLERMGQRLATDSEPRGAIPALAGFQFQKVALEEREAMLGPLASTESAASIAEARTKVGQASQEIADFLDGLDERIRAERREFVLPFLLFAETVPFAGTAYLLAYLVRRLIGRRKLAKSIPHSRAIFGVAAIPIGLFAVAHAFTLVQRAPGAQGEYAGALIAVWWTVLGVGLSCGMIYPLAALRSPADVGRETGRLEEMANTLTAARRAYRDAYTALTLRYYGILFGLLLCGLCAWVVTYRMGIGLYPWQFKILAPGYMDEESEIVSQALTLLL
ncbi:MAG: hypothetical protein AAB353_05565 [Candidatus Hydrogenedentota bacterium]